jgi:phosphoribosylamine-glycine ligase
MDKGFLKNAIQKNRIKNLSSSNKNNFPPVQQMIKNLSNDVIKTVQHVAAGGDLKTEDTEALNRKKICNSCEFFNKAQERCTKCGCYMAVKVYLKAAHCPINKW